VLVFTAEEAWGYLPRLQGDEASVHLALSPGVNEGEKMSALRAHALAALEPLAKKYESLGDMRREVNLRLEEARREKVIGSSTEAAVVLGCNGEMLALAREFGAAALADMFIVSVVELVESPNGLTVQVKESPGGKCSRCWLYRNDVGTHAHPNTCGRCDKALQADEAA